MKGGGSVEGEKGGYLRVCDYADGRLGWTRRWEF